MLQDVASLTRLQQTFQGLIEVNCDPAKAAWASTLAVINECAMVSVLQDDTLDKPKKKKVLEGLYKKLQDQEKNIGAIQTLIHKAIFNEAAKLMYDNLS